MPDKKIMIKAAVFSAVCSLLITIILNCLIAAVMLSIGLLPDYILNCATITTLGIGTLLGGFISARITKSAGMINGVITGFLVFLLITLIGVAKSNDSFTMISLVKLIVCIACAGFGGIIGVNKKERIKIK